ncbi:MAG: S8 family serine peptidase, partial [Kiritimatiellales bacterium]|nr:S8 family serine peptidase [Kiritimatiellales bacterium]
MHKSTLVVLTLCLFARCAQAEVLEFRLDQNHIWLTVQNEPLPRLLERFVAAGVDVQIDPDAQKSITGTCADADLETILDQLLVPYDYLLDWHRESGPLGDLSRLIGIRVFRKGHAGSVQPLRPPRRIETSFDGKFRYMAREILVGFGAGASIENLRTFLARTGGTIIEANQKLGIYRILLPEGANVIDLVNQLGNEPSIALAEPNYVVNLPGLLPGGGTASVPGQWNAPSGDSPFAVSILDSGLLADDNLNRAVISSFDATNPNAPLTADTVGHGTLMAGLAAGLLDPYATPVGEGASVVAIKVFGDDGSADSFTLMNAMTYAVEKSRGPVSLSWGSETPSRFIESAVQYVLDQGRPVFAAVGNENTGKPIYPAAYPGVVGVAAANGDQYADYSNRGDFVDLVAPGSAGGSQGTSVATAYVSHVAALYMQHNPKATAA